jgi:hypothetical protein
LEGGASSEGKDSDGSSGRVASSRTMLEGDPLIRSVVGVEDGVCWSSTCKHHVAFSSNCVIRTFNGSLSISITPTCATCSSTRHRQRQCYCDTKNQPVLQESVQRLEDNEDTKS